MIKTAALATSFILFFLFYWWGTAGDFFLPFSVFFPQFHFIFVVVLTATIILGRDCALFIPIFEFLEMHRYKIFPLFGLLTAILINIFVFDNIPHVQDGIHYKHIAEVFSHGQIAHVMPNHYEFFIYPFFMVDGSHYFSIFLPGFPIFLTPFALFGLTFLANPLLTAINILLVGFFAQYLFGFRSSTISMLLFVISPFMMTMSGTWMPHPFTALLTLIAAFSVIKFASQGGFHLPIVAGSAMGWMIFTRPQNALFLAVLFLVFLTLEIKGRDFVRTIALFSGPIVLGIIILLSYNHAFTGSPLTFIQDIYFDTSEPVDDCHRIGLATGCLHCNGESLPRGGMTWQHGVTVTKERIIPLVMETFPHPLFFAFLILSLTVTMNNFSESRKKLFLVALFLAPVCGYFLFYFNGNVFGPRYLYEGTVFLIILTASGIDILLRRLEERKLRFGSRILVSFIVCSLLFEIAVVVPRMVSVYKHGFWGVGPLLKDLVVEGDFGKSVFFVSIVDEMSYGNGLVAMDLSNFEDNERIFVRDLGDESNSKYMHYMKGWDFYRVRYVPWKDQSVHPKRIEPVLLEETVHVEMEDKFLPYSRGDGNPDYCNVYPVQEHVQEYLGFPKIEHRRLSSMQSLYCRFVNEDQSYTFGQYFPKSGVYTSTLAAVSGPDFGDLDIFVDDGLVASIALNDRNDTSLTEFVFEIDVSQGLHTFRIGPNQESFPNRNYFMIDFIRFEKTGDGN